MALSVSVRNEEPVGSLRSATVTVVTVGQLDAEEVKHVLGPQNVVTVPVHQGQFILVDQTETEGG